MNAVPLQTKAVQQAMDQKDFHRAVELRGRLVVHAGFACIRVFYTVMGCCSNTINLCVYSAVKAVMIFKQL